LIRDHIEGFFRKDVSMPSINQMTGAGSGEGVPPAQRPTSTSAEPGTSSVSAGGEPKTSAGVATLDAANSDVLVQGTQSFSQGIGLKPVLQAEPERGDNDENVSSNPGGRVSGFPDAGAGPGTGLTTKPGTIGQTKARPRTPFNPNLMRGGK
jgi:hypothetical protein